MSDSVLTLYPFPDTEAKMRLTLKETNIWSPAITLYESKAELTFQRGRATVPTL